MERKEAAAQKKLEEMQELQKRNQQNEQEKAAKKDLIMQIKADIEPLIIEANEIAENIGKNIKFELQFAGIHQEDNQTAYGERIAADELLKQRKEKPEIKVENYDTQQIYLWTPEKFRERLTSMRDMISFYGDSPQDNPFVDEPEPLLIGEGYYSLEALANFIDNPAIINLIGPTFEVHGKLEVNIIPVNPDGTGTGDDEEVELIPDEPSDLIDQRIDFLVQIDKCLELPDDLCRDVYVEYQFYLDQTKYKTKVCTGKNRNQDIDYKH